MYEQLGTMGWGLVVVGCFLGTGGIIIFTIDMPIARQQALSGASTAATIDKEKSAYKLSNSQIAPIDGNRSGIEMT